jgi:hypothetical protein
MFDLVSTLANELQMVRSQPLGGGMGSAAMGGGGGGSGYIHTTAIFGATYTGSYRIPPFSFDPDLQIDNNYQYGFGAEESGQGGPGVIVIYY